MREAKYIVLLLFILLIQGCDLFNTRTPEDPDTGRSTFQPPTQPSIVVSNFRNAISEKNIDNYLLCFSDNSVDSSIGKFIFHPSVDASTLYPGLFDNWGSENERKYFNSLKSRLPSDINPIILFKNESYGISQPDSVVITYKYYLKLNFVDNSIDKEYAGTIQLTLVSQKNGLWSIFRWQDIKSPNDTIDATWSKLKGQMIN